MKYLLPIAITCVLTAGCATQKRGVTDYFRVDTIPQGAKVETSIAVRSSVRKNKRDPSIPIEYLGCEPTPCSIRLARTAEFVATITHDGFEPAEFYVGHSTRRVGMHADMAQNMVAGPAGTAAGAAIFAGGAYLAADTITFGLLSSTTSAGSVIGPIAGQAAVAGLGVGAGMIVVDAVSGANLNLVPNPVVLRLAPQGTAVKKDPLVAQFREGQKAKLESGEP